MNSAGAWQREHEEASRDFASTRPGDAGRETAAFRALSAAGGVLLCDRGSFDRELRARMDPALLEAALEGSVLRHLEDSLLAYLRRPAAGESSTAGEAAALSRRRDEVGRALEAAVAVYARGRTSAADPLVRSWRQELARIDDLVRERIAAFLPLAETSGEPEGSLAMGWRALVEEELASIESRLVSPLTSPACRAGILGRRELLAAWAANGISPDRIVERAVEQACEGRSFREHLLECDACRRELGEIVLLESEAAGETDFWDWCREGVAVVRSRSFSAAADAPSSRAHPLAHPAIRVPGSSVRFAFLPQERALVLFDPEGGEPGPGWRVHFYRDPAWPPVPRGPAVSLDFVGGRASWDPGAFGLRGGSPEEIWNDLCFWIETQDGKVFHSFRLPCPAE
ncbi:MAG: hypothetical protein HY720_02365 [Planctomycetes bacterium]|nr:hypothetical protein [Planctomycetota bacterium]